MRSLLLITLLAVTISITFNQIAFAVCGEGPTFTFTCNTNPPNPDTDGIQQGGNNNNLTVNVLDGAGIETSGNNAIALGDGNNEITITNADIFAEINKDAINVGDGNNLINVTGSNLTGNDGIDGGLGGGLGVKTINIINSSISAKNDSIFSGNGNDILFIKGSTLFSSTEEAIAAGRGDDEVTVINSILTSTGGVSRALEGGPDNDTITLGTGAELNGFIDCGDGSADTLIFAMDVPEEAVAFISSQIASKDPAGDSIVINDLFYEWEECELLVSEIVGVSTPRPIPTLSEWGLIAMAGILGLVGFVAIRRRKAAA